MCEYTATTHTYTLCKQTPVKHHVRIQVYMLCEKGLGPRQHCADSRIAKDALIGSSRTAGECPTCTSSTTAMIKYAN
ncbi:hypothetical protein CDV36_016124 [Fusarium kuroshium]|uniref:Uncharacterized protein n=2 Tax=Fusarium solani species complex TaxID=232080 RepID=A0A3M2QZL8_9HYPO|nr:hypothetical protein CDV36_016124 [Fusarium kuroshium]RSL82780.1 hypothetical protein CDV31_016901 [Fusarium ambrosium]